MKQHMSAPSSPPESPASAVQEMAAKRQKKGGAFPPAAEIRELVNQGIHYFEARVKAVNLIQASAQETDIADLQSRIEKLEKITSKTDTQYLELAVAERKLSDLSARRDKDQTRSRSAQKILAREVLHWAPSFASSLSEANSKSLSDALEHILQPYLDGRPVLEVLPHIPAWHRAVYGNRLNIPSHADIMKIDFTDEATDIGVVSAQAAISYFRAALEGPFFTGKKS
jgi:hypothetical protein